MQTTKLDADTVSFVLHYIIHLAGTEGVLSLNSLVPVISLLPKTITGNFVVIIHQLRYTSDKWNC